jgi:hypothetical protein
MIYVDMDGVVADFNAKMREMYGHDMEEMNPDDMNTFWNTQCVSEQAFNRLPPMHEGALLVQMLMLEKLPFCFLTSTGGGCMHYDIAKQKIDWLHRHFGRSLPVAFCTGTQSKAQFASPGHFLIDDRQKVVDAFIEGGGKAHLFVPERWEEALKAAVEWEKERAAC